MTDKIFPVTFGDSCPLSERTNKQTNEHTYSLQYFATLKSGITDFCLGAQLYVVVDNMKCVKPAFHDADTDILARMSVSPGKR